MRKGMVLALLVSMLCSCAGRDLAPSTSPESPSIEPQPAQVMSLIGRFGLAHACPVNDHIVTAAHVATIIPRGSMSQYSASYVYQQGERTGLITMDTSHAPSRFVDIAWMRLEQGDSPVFNKRAAGLQVDDAVHWYEYEYGAGQAMLRLVRRDSIVTQMIAGHLVTEESPEHGASGGCIFNESGEVVGIVSFGLAQEGTGKLGPFGYKPLEWSGVGVILTDEWGW